MARDGAEGDSYYEILGITSDAQNEDIAKAFRQLALRYHPELNQDSHTSDCARRFRQVAEAYEVLSNPNYRKPYDEYGMSGLKSGECPGVPAYKFAGDPLAVFKAFFPVSNPFQMIGDPPFSACDGTQHMFFSETAAQPRVPPQCRAKELSVDCTLDDVYSGAFKKVSYTNDHLAKKDPKKQLNFARDNVEKKGAVVRQEEMALCWQVAPGTAPNDRVTFAQKGTTADGHTPGDVHVTMHQLPHSDFVRDGDNLIYTHTVQLNDALCGFTMKIPTIDGRTLQVHIDDVVHPTYTKRVRGEGVPVKDGGGAKGDLIIRFETEFPTYLADDKREEIRRILRCKNAA